MKRIGSLPDLAVFIPTRHRRERAEACIKSFRETVEGDADIYLVVDDDDDGYQDTDVPVIVTPRGTMVTAANKAAEWLATEYRALLMVGDDCIFVTPGWDKHMMESLERLGGSGFVYPDDKRRTDVPEIVLISSDIVQSFGWFADPAFGHFFVDNVWAELGKRSDLIRFCPKAVIEHKHYSMDSSVVRDAMYLEAEETFGDPDRAAFEKWQAERMTTQVAKLRREFNKDLDWLLSLV
jgi:hypothetical protein